MNELRIQFPTERHMKEFRSWLSRQGEQGFMDEEDIVNPEDSITHFLYSYQDGNKYSPMPDDLVVAQANGKGCDEPIKNPNTKEE
jgi:hypothetical protein